MKKCKFKEAVCRGDATCEYADNAPTQKCINGCGFYEKYEDLMADARAVQKELAERGGYDT